MTLEGILNFCTGSTHPLPGDSFDCTLKFNHLDPYPTASTCSLTLTLPTQYQLYIDFKEACRVAFTLHGGFGLS